MDKSMDRNRRKLEGDIRKEVTKMFELILDYAQIAVPTKETFQALRSRVLRSGNDCIRNLCSSLDVYKIKYDGKTEDIVEIVTKRQHKQ